MSTPVTPATPKVSWLKHVGNIIGKIISFVAHEGKPIADIAAGVATVLFPALAAQIEAGDALVSKIALQALSVEGATAAVGQASGTGIQKLDAVVQAVGPAIDQWVANAFPGSKQISTVLKAGLVNAVVAIAQDVAVPATATSSTPLAV